MNKYSQTTNINKESAKLSNEEVETDVEKAKRFTEIYLWKLLENFSKREQLRAMRLVCSN